MNQKLKISDGFLLLAIQLCSSTALLLALLLAHQRISSLEKQLQQAPEILQEARNRAPD